MRLAEGEELSSLNPANDPNSKNGVSGSKRRCTRSRAIKIRHHSFSRTGWESRPYQARVLSARGGLRNALSPGKRTTRGRPGTPSARLPSRWYSVGSRRCPGRWSVLDREGKPVHPFSGGIRAVKRRRRLPFRIAPSSSAPCKLRKRHLFVLYPWMVDAME